MSSPTYDSIILKASTLLETITASFSHKGYMAISSYLAGPIGKLCILYIVLTGLAIILGYTDKPIDEFKKIVLRIGVVYTLAFSWGNFSGYVIDLLNAISNGLGAKIMQLIPFDLPLLNGTGVNGALQTILIESSRVGQWVMNKGSFYSPTPWITGLAIIGFGGVVALIAFIEIVSAKFILAVCFCLAPLFFAMTLLDKTRAYFDQWIGVLVGQALVAVFVSGGVGLCVHLVHFTLGEHLLSRAVNITFTDWIPLALFSLLSIKILVQLAGIAERIGGSCHSSGSSAMVGALLGSAMGSASRAGVPATKNLAGMGLKALSKLTPNGAVAQLGAKAGLKMIEGGGRAMSAIQNRMRSSQSN